MPALNLSCFAWFLRFLLIAHVHNPYWIAVIETSMGLCFSLPNGAAMEYIKMHTFTEVIIVFYNKSTPGLVNAAYIIRRNFRADQFSNFTF